MDDVAQFCIAEAVYARMDMAKAMSHTHGEVESTNGPIDEGDPALQAALEKARHFAKTGEQL